MSSCYLGISLASGVLSAPAELKAIVRSRVLQQRSCLRSQKTSNICKLSVLAGTDICARLMLAIQI